MLHVVEYIVDASKTFSFLKWSFKLGLEGKEIFGLSNSNSKSIVI